MARRQEGTRVRPLIVIAAIGFVLIVGLLAFNLLSGGETPAPAPAASPGPTRSPIVIATPQPTPAPDAVEVFEIFEGRDPFRPLVVEATPGVSPSPGPASPTPPGGGTPAPTPRPPREGVQVELLAVADDGGSATVRVGSQVFRDVRPGRTLASGVVLDAIEGRCARFHRGNDRFRLCEGESVLK